MAKNKTLKSKMEEIKKIDEKSINKKRIADEIKEESEKEKKNKKENKQELELFSSNEPKEKINIVSLNTVKEKEELEEEKLTKEKVEKNKKRERERLAKEEKEKKKEKSEANEEKNNKKIKEEKEKRKKKIIKKLKKDNNKEDELFNLNIEITRNKFGLDQEEFINERIKTVALDKIKKDDNISGKKTNKNDKKNKKNLKEDDMFSNHLIEELEEPEENNIEKILKEHNKSRLFGKNKKKKLIYKVAIELIVFMVVAILLLFTYFTVFKFKILTNKQLMFIPVIFAIASFFFLEIGFKEKEYMKFIRGLELIAFSYIYTYYLNVLEITFMYPINQKEIWFGIYGYFAIKLLIIGTSEKRKHNKTYLDIKDITK